MMQSSLRIFSGILALSLSGSLYALPECPSDTSARWHNCFGTYTWRHGEKYVGEYKENQHHGQGTYTFADGKKYVGEFKDSKRHGQGTYTFADGKKYVGEWKEDKWHGQGTLTFPDGSAKRGYYMNGEYVPDFCQDMGLTKGTEAFGQCVLKLIDEITKDN